MSEGSRGFECRFCRGGSADLVHAGVPDRLHRKPGTFDYVRCSQCGLLQIETTPANVAEYYESYRVHRRETAAYRLVRRLLMGNAYVLETGRGDLLDVGCGNGWYMVEMARRGWRPTGSESDAQHADRLRQQLGLPVVSDLTELQGPSFDLVTLNFVFEHLTDPLGTLRQVAALVRPGGRVVISVPNPESREARIFGSRWFHLDPPRHITLFSAALLRRALEEVGLVPGCVEEVGVPTGLAGSLSYSWAGRFTPLIWYPAMPAGLVFSALYPDGLYRITATRPQPTDIAAAH